MIAAKTMCNAEKASTDQKLRIQTNGNLFASKYYSFRDVQYKQDGYCLNLCKVLYDREIECLEDAKVFSEQLSDWVWASIFTIPKGHDDAAKVCGSGPQLMINKKLWESFIDWMRLLLQCKDATQSVSGRELIKSRVAHLYLQMIKVEGKHTTQLLEIVDEYSQECADRAIVGLEKAELKAQLFRYGEELMINLLVLAFKKRLIAVELTHEKLKDPIETYLFYSLVLNEVLMLKNKNEAMLFPRMAEKYPISEVLDKIFKRMTIEDLVGFVSNDPVFREAQPKKNDADQRRYLEKIEKLKSKIAMLDYGDQRVGLLNNQYQKTTDDFYRFKAKQLLIEKGFITKNVNYDDPVSCPAIKKIVASEPINPSSKLSELLLREGILAFIILTLTALLTVSASIMSSVW